ncbi:hypothetical protein [Mycobacterium sp.]|uniref:hypothetical protein n=1 Tax=Mycobacterium sp. TaxID=1785 RepID=UPI0025ED14F5|nr:hypothetical protein [Mycobacterium sp.]
MTFELNQRGVEHVLKEMAANHVRAVADKVAAAAGEDAEVAEYTTDRAVASVRVPAHQQAKDGVLTRAAAAAGLEVRSK